MNANEKEYIDFLKKSVYERISLEINSLTVEHVAKNDLIKSHIDNKVSSGFQEYYFLTLNNEDFYLKATDFFRQFKKRYSLQGIDNNFLEKLEIQKKDILRSIREDKLAQLYFKTFNKAEIKHGEGIKEKDLGSFFAKLVHTFRPYDYCALDNPIKNYFRLKKESFIIAFFIISDVYTKWATGNKEFVFYLKENLKKADKNLVINHEKLTDLKLLDLVFWSKANRL